MKATGSLEHTINTLETESYYNDYTFYCFGIERQIGCLIALPFFTYDKEHNQKFEGYLIYHNPNSYVLSEDELHLFGMKSIAQASLSGMADNLSPLPYKLISEDDIEDALDSIICKNTFTNLKDPIGL